MKLTNLKPTNLVAGDDHGNQEFYTLGGAVELSNGKVAALIANEGVYCLNELYINADGQLRVSQWSVGGTVGVSGIVDVETYNKRYITKIQKVITDECDILKAVKAKGVKNGE